MVRAKKQAVSKKAKKRRNAARLLGVEKKEVVKPPNPFDLKYKKVKKTPVVSSKTSVSGSKGMKVAGRPVESKTRAIAVRKQTLSTLMSKEGKKNQFEDRRIGANLGSSKMPGKGQMDKDDAFDEVMFKKLATQRQHMFEKVPKVSRYQLAANDDSDGEGRALGESVELTHLGQSIGEMERFDTPTTALEAEEDNVETAEDRAFQEALNSSDNSKLTLKEKMQKLIAVSKMSKAIQKETNDRVAEQTDELDVTYKDISHLLAGVPTIVERTQEEIEVDRSYGSFMERVAECAKALPSDPLPEEAKAEENGVEIVVASQSDVRNPQLKPIPSNHVSADDLGESFLTGREDSKEREGESEVKYTQEGKIMLPKEFRNKPIARKVRTNRRLSDDEDNSDDASGGDDLELLEDEDEDLSDMDEDGEEMSDVDENYDSSEESEASKECEVEEIENSDFEPNNDDKNESDVDTTSEISSEFFPQGFDEFLLKVLQQYAVEGSKLNEYLENVLEKLFPRTDYKKTSLKLLQHLLMTIESHVSSRSLTETLDRNFIEILSSIIRKICMKNSESSFLYLKNVFLEKFQKLKSSNALSIDLYLFCQLVSEIYDMSANNSMRSLFLTVCITVSKVLSKCKLSSISDLRLYLLFANFLLELNAKSSHFVPEVIIAVDHVLRLTTCQDVEECNNVLLPSGFLRSGLRVETKKKRKRETTPVDCKQLLFETEMRMKQTPLTRSHLILFALDILRKCVDSWKELPGITETLRYSQSCIESVLDEDNLVTNERMREKMLSAKKELMELKEVKKGSLKLMEKKPKPLKQFNPRVIQEFDQYKAQGPAWGSQNEKMRKRRQLRRETRGAMKELQKDSVFLQKMKMEQQLQLDSERKEKVKQIYGQLANQEGDVKKVKKAKFQLI